MSDILLNIVFPSAILMFGASYLGPRLSLLIALLGPLVALAVDRWRTGRTTPLSAIALVSILLSGAIGLVEVDTRWFAVKEAALPLAYALLVAGSAWTPWPAMDAILKTLLDPDKVRDALLANGQADGWRARVRRDTLLFAVTLAGSAAASGALAATLVRSPSASTAYVEEIGRYTAWSLPVITIPSLGVVVWLFRASILDLEERCQKDLDALKR